MIETFLPAIERLPVERPLTKKDLLTESFTMEKEGELEMYFAPHNEYLNREAKIIIAGITPGWNQMKTAYEHFTTCLAGDNPLGICLKKAKIAARFAGSMKANLIHMLDQCGIPQILGIRQSAINQPFVIITPLCVRDIPRRISPNCSPSINHPPR